MEVISPGLSENDWQNLCYLFSVELSYTVPGLADPAGAVLVFASKNFTIGR
jgi:hypothetical protein